MTPLQAFGEQVVGWMIVGLYLLVPGVVAMICWAPFLASERIRSLFRMMPPFTSSFLTYGVISITASLPFVLGIAGVLATVGPDDLWGPPILGVTLVLFISYVVAIPIIGVLGLPRMRIDWDPFGYDSLTWLVLTAGGVWYTTILAVPLTALGLILSLPSGW